MLYFVVKQPLKAHQISLDDFLSGKNIVFYDAETNKSATKTIVFKSDNLPSYMYEKYKTDTVDASVFAKVQYFVNEYKDIDTTNIKKHYKEFYIPKKSGGLRKIDAPDDRLKQCLTDMKRLFEEDLKVKHHTSAYAYVKNRSPIMAVKQHQGNDSKWFLKTDFSDFFGSTNKEFILKTLKEVYPFNVLMSTPSKKELERMIDLCLLDDKLPQGTPMSPLLTNLIMIPIDYKLYNMFRKESKVYTRYADDIIVSSKVNFDHKGTVEQINNACREMNAPYVIKQEKTRYGSSAGRNWNLGIMLNKDNKLSIGNKKKEQFKAMCHSFLCDYKNGTHWEYHDLQVFRGLISYYSSIEKERIFEIIQKANNKHSLDLMSVLKKELSV